MASIILKKPEGERPPAPRGYNMAIKEIKMDYQDSISDAEYCTSLEKISNNATSLISSSEQAYNEFLARIMIAPEKMEASKTALAKTQSKDLAEYKASTSWWKRVFGSATPKASAQTKLLETIVAMETQISSGTEAFSKIPKMITGMDERYKDLFKERNKLREQLREYKGFFESFKDNEEQRLELIQLLKSYGMINDERKTILAAALKNLNNVELLPPLEDEVARQIVIDSIECDAFNSKGAYEARKLELVLINDRYASVERQIASLLEQKERFMTSFTPGLASLSRLRGKYEELSLCAESSILLMDLSELVEATPKLTAEAEEAIQKARDQLDKYGCNEKARIRVSADLEGGVPLADIQKDPCKAIDQILNLHSCTGYDEIPLNDAEIIESEVIEPKVAVEND